MEFAANWCSDKSYKVGFLGSINAELMPEYFQAAYIFGCKRNTAMSANKPKYTFLLLTSVYISTVSVYKRLGTDKLQHGDIFTTHENTISAWFCIVVTLLPKIN